MRILPPSIWLAAGLIYVVCPLDLDFVPVVGWLDDVVVAYLCIKRWRQAKLPGPSR